MTDEYEYLVESQWAGWWGGYGAEHVIEDHLDRRAAEGWRLAKVERGYFLWNWYIPRTKLIYFWERVRTTRGSRAMELADRVEEAKHMASSDASGLQPSPVESVPDSTTQAMETIEIPFPENSIPRNSPFDLNAETPFSQTFLQRLGYENVKPSECRWQPGITLVWHAWREYFQEQIEKLTAEGWELIEPFEEYDEDGLLVNAEDRFVFDQLEEGDDSTSVFSAAEFQMQERSSR